MRQIFADAKVHSSIFHNEIYICTFPIESFLLVRGFLFFFFHSFFFAFIIYLSACVLVLRENMLTDRLPACLCIAQFLTLAIVNMADCTRFYRSLLQAEWKSVRAYTLYIPILLNSFSTFTTYNTYASKNMKSDGYFNQHVFALWILIGRKISSMCALGIFIICTII